MNFVLIYLVSVVVVMKITTIQLEFVVLIRCLVTTTYTSAFKQHFLLLFLVSFIMVFYLLTISDACYDSYSTQN